MANAAPPAQVTSGEHIRAYGADVTARLKAWWAAQPDKSCRAPVKMYYGMHALHQFPERSTWHSAQHARQIVAVLERLGIGADGPPSADDHAGLPMPEGLWE